MGKKVLYFYQDKALYVFSVTGLYLGLSLFTLINMSLLGQVSVTFCSLVFTGSVINFIIRKGQIIKRGVRLILLLMSMVSINFYTYLLNNITVYPLIFIVTHLLGGMIACVIYYRLLVTDDNKKINICLIVLLLLFILLFSYLKIGVSLSFWSAGAITLFTFIQMGSVTPMILVICDQEQTFLICQLQNKKLIEGVSMIFYSSFTFSLLLVWDVFFLFLVYKSIIEYIYY